MLVISIALSDTPHGQAVHRCGPSIVLHEQVLASMMNVREHLYPRDDVAKVDPMPHARRYAGVQHFSAGDLLREEVKSGNNAELEAIMKEGKLVPMETTIELLHNAMQKRPGEIFLIDGFPRALDQAAAFEKQVRALRMAEPTRLQPSVLVSHA